MDITRASSYDDNPIVSRWREGVARRGGKTMPTGYPFDPHKGAPTAWWNDPSKAGGRKYELAPTIVQLAIGYERKKDAANLAAGAGVERLEASAKAVGLDKGLAGVLGKALGIDHRIIVIVAVIAGSVLAYSALVNVGIVPPIRKVG